MPGKIAVTGSVAFDVIMVFPGHFRDHILLESAHLLNVSFLVDKMQRRHGGTAANIAYSLALLGEWPLLCAAVGADFEGEYADRLRGFGVDLSSSLVCNDLSTAVGFITTDLSDNQITAFYPGAMARSARLDLSKITGVEHVIVSPDAPDSMELHIQEAEAMGAKLIFAPGQQIPSLSDAALQKGLETAWMIVGNDYEFRLIESRTGLAIDALRKARGRERIVAMTGGGAGSVLYTADQTLHIPIAPAAKVVDPTGCGDAYLAGLLAGIRAGRSLADAGRMAALAATYVVECTGTQEHFFEPDEFAARYASAFEGSAG